MLIFQTEIDYLRHIIEYNKISKSPDKIWAVQKISLHILYRQWIKTFSWISNLLFSLYPEFFYIIVLFELSVKEEPQFVFVLFFVCYVLMVIYYFKSELWNDHVLVPYDPSLPLILTTDVSPTGFLQFSAMKLMDRKNPLRTYPVFLHLGI